MTDWQPIQTAPRGDGTSGAPVFCDHPEWDLPGWCWWGVGVRGHEGGRWYEVGEAQWLEPQPTHWLALPPRIKTETEGPGVRLRDPQR